MKRVKRLTRKQMFEAGMKIPKNTKYALKKKEQKRGIFKDNSPLNDYL